jgi:hypothetical protein
MPYGERNGDGQVVQLRRDAAPGATEFIDSHHPDIAAFLYGEGVPHFAELDSGFVRVVEDLVDVLMANGTLRITDLPIEAQHKISARKHLRQTLIEAVNPLDPDEVI